MTTNLSNGGDDIVASISAEIAKTEPSRRQRVIEAFILAALSSIPWVGGF